MIGGESGDNSNWYRISSFAAHASPALAPLQPRSTYSDAACLSRGCGKRRRVESLRGESRLQNGRSLRRFCGARAAAGSLPVTSLVLGRVRPEGDRRPEARSNLATTSSLQAQTYPPPWPFPGLSCRPPPPPHVQRRPPTGARAGRCCANYAGHDPHHRPPRPALSEREPQFTMVGSGHPVPPSPGHVLLHPAILVAHPAPRALHEPDTQRVHQLDEAPRREEHEHHQR